MLYIIALHTLHLPLNAPFVCSLAIILFVQLGHLMFLVFVCTELIIIPPPDPISKQKNNKFNKLYKNCSKHYVEVYCLQANIKYLTHIIYADYSTIYTYFVNTLSNKCFNYLLINPFLRIPVLFALSSIFFSFPFLL